MKLMSGSMATVIVLLTIVARASSASVQQQVLAREALWLKAITTHDTHTLASILDDGFVHINYKGHSEGKAAMLERIASGVSFDERTSDHHITFAGPVAVVHGLNTITSKGRVVAKLRYTDVYALRGSAWKALSAQETLIR